MEKGRSTPNRIYQDMSIGGHIRETAPMTRSIATVIFLVVTAGICLTQATGAVTLSVAAADSSPEEKRYADRFCDGTGDQIEIQKAINDLPGEGGEVVLLSGHFRCDDTIRLRPGTMLSGRAPA